ncbi:hypothetical protein EYZ11_002670 [Aspergillus tanneri]|uniref:Uncharacterized protein n=1 Tax=Aspergillus tanneri TaxID=1220188 RepID=A0A4S3JQY8_9EURO|nr:hypothetical protein EYZ11_002670 [Aspergillus tanneri]
MAQFKGLPTKVIMSSQDRYER